MERFHEIGRGKIAAIATSLEMRERPAPRPAPSDLPGQVVPWPKPDAPTYLALYRKVGAAHLWFSRLYMSPAELEAALASPATMIFSWRVDGEDEGLLELDFAGGEDCEIKYFGVTERLQGTGAARALMNHAIETGFARPIRRLWLHTNTIDHPRALGFYRRTGFEPIGQSLEIADDPRLNGALPRDAAPHIPIFD
ncbi:N-acetyltransferase [Aureimonas sp. AU20]|uniref:GNAT family N-acetyltransferase n=1 Tax=Aureimonas sp. AU20 TaxID=1349819 RepID=UPI0007219783|nr:GNAT family N-acetyltransferase [Aureimonas sp. AU20]ALN71426.1 hypothetical protein M673_01810 [Aureimonas sp. AU20]